MNNLTSNLNIPLEVFQFDRQEELAIFAANSILKELFSPDNEILFRTYDESRDQFLDKQYNEILAIKSQNREFLSKATLKVSLVRLGANFPKLIDEPYLMIIDKFKEFINQFLGVINQNIINSIGMEFRIGLPTHFGNIANNEENLMVPGTRIVDSTGTFDLNIGFVRIRGSQDINLNDSDFVLLENSNNDIDFF